VVNSVLTNRGAMTALTNLQATQKNLLETQNRISTGLKVGSAADNAATWAIATAMRSDIANFNQVSENLSMSTSIVGTARGGAESIAKLLEEMKAKVTSAQNPAVDRAQVQSDIDELVGQIQSITESSQFKGVNLLNDEGIERMLSAVNDVAGASTPSYINVNKVNLSVEGGDLSDLGAVDVTSRGDSLFNRANPTAAQAATDAAMATRRISFNNGADHTAGTYTVQYKDAEGVAKTLSVTVTAAATGALLADQLNADSEFKKLFRAEDGSGDAVRLSAVSRDVEVGKFEITGVAGSAVAAALTTVGSASSTTMTFQNTPLKDGETFSVKYRINSTTAEKTVVLKVADETSGTSLGLDADGNQIYAINKNIVADSTATGTQISDEVRLALLGSTNFTGAGADGVSLAVTSAAGVLTISSADDTDGVIGFEPPQTDYATLLKMVDKAIDTVTDAAASFGSSEKRIGLQKDFMDGLVKTLTAGVGSLVDADMSSEAARLQALQVQEQLGTQALSIANQAPQSILTLFR
jgi:flagellin